MMHSLYKRLHKVFLISAILTLAGCGFSESLTEAEDLIDTFRAHVAENDIDTIYMDIYHPDVRKQLSRQDLTGFMRNYRPSIIKTSSRSRISWNSNVGTSGTTVTLVYSGKLNGSSVTEKFVLKSDGDILKLWHYAFNVSDADALEKNISI
ncbi:hypothetical protein GCM10017044_19180 [Kordiimonas sediminis]|uniref:SnoaL-like domain-containing protein n=1 Tax=Kordiimonas sediminis TaxID=1735581 RepID=A0A919E8J8_9PROT|nr:hypothetical protein [Kordiimonas sediminis]GHF24663.1 hypothetical protein GCM10017044_19180 [Kordiimonas sediminis]